MVINPAFHSMQVHLLMGSLFVSLFSALFMVVLKRLRPELYENVKGHIDVTIFIGMGLAAILTVFSIVTGMLSLPVMANLNSPIIKNKILISLLMMMVVFFSLGIRYFYRNKAFLENSALQKLSYSLILVAFIFGVVASAVGGELTARASGFEELMIQIGIQTRWSFYLPNSLLLIVLGLGIIAVLVPFLISVNKTAGNREKK